MLPIIFEEFSIIILANSNFIHNRIASSMRSNLNSDIIEIISIARKSPARERAADSIPVVTILASYILILSMLRIIALKLLMIELIKSGVPNIVCTQPFGCLPNHVVGKGVIKELRHQYPDSNIVAVDYDPGASEVNQLNRIKLMLSTAGKNLQTENLYAESKDNEETA